MKSSSTLENCEKLPDARAASSRVPGATYRLQFHAGFTFSQAKNLVPYLRSLGITDIYCSPVFQAAPGSAHGYDTCGLGTVNDELGGGVAFRDFANAVAESGGRLLLDIVPNHMGTHATNQPWWDVLKNGQKSRFACWFDIDWEREGADGRVLLPVLGERIGAVLDQRQLRLTRSDSTWELNYYDNRFPIAPGTPRALLEAAAVCHDPELVSAVLKHQCYRLAYWRVGPEEINYRRFFDVSSLVALRMHDESVFESTHSTVMELLASGAISGLRIDHPDGLRDPRQYLQRLRDRAQCLCGIQTQGPYVVVEKILGAHEKLPRDWPVDGTTGYDFLTDVNGLLVAQWNEATMTATYREFIGSDSSFEDAAYDGKKKVLEASFTGELDVLAKQLAAVARGDRDGLDLTRRQLRAAIVEVIACFPVYRTYASAEATTLSDFDLECVNKAITEATRRYPGLTDAIEFLGQVLALRIGSVIERAKARDFVMRFQQLTGPAAAKGIEDTAFYNYHRLISLNEVGGDPNIFGIEPKEFHARNQDRAHHWPHSLLATATHDTKRGEDVRCRLNVISEMPRDWREAVLRWRSSNAGFKASIGAPDANDEYLIYQTLVGMWDDRELARERIERLTAYALKAARESKRNTSWTEREAAYEEGLQNFVRSILDPERNEEFLKDVRKLAGDLAFFGSFNSISQTVLKFTCPGVPDTYQGCELLDLSLVDPDNRRPVDFDRRMQLLDELQDQFRTGNGEEAAGNLIAQSGGTAKMLATWRLLQLRNEHRALFDDGVYVPLKVTGVASDHVCAFVRSVADQVLIVVVPRLVRTLLGGEQIMPLKAAIWKDTTLAIPSGASNSEFSEALTGRVFVANRNELRVGELLRSFPAAVLTARVE